MIQKAIPTGPKCADASGAGFSRSGAKWLGLANELAPRLSPQQAAARRADELVLDIVSGDVASVQDGLKTVRNFANGGKVMASALVDALESASGIVDDVAIAQLLSQTAKELKPKTL